MRRVGVPPEVDRLALKEDEEEVEYAEDDATSNEDADDPELHLVDGDTTQEQADRDFEKGRAGRVEQFAEKPVLSMAISQLSCQYFGVHRVPSMRSEHSQATLHRSYVRCRGQRLLSDMKHML